MIDNGRSRWAIGPVSMLYQLASEGLDCLVTKHCKLSDDARTERSKTFSPVSVAEQRVQALSATLPDMTNGWTDNVLT